VTCAGQWCAGARAEVYDEHGARLGQLGGRYVTLWRRQPDGGWKIWADIGVP
jgi:ketosteroid isomerase-like protein